MKYRVSTIVLIVVLLLVLIVQNIQAASPDPSNFASVNLVAPTGDYDFVNHGTAWVPEIRSKFSVLRYVGWGLATRAKAAGDQWVHIPLLYPARIAGSLMKISYVEFCAKSSNGASTKPTRMDLWAYDGRFLAQSISWAANNNEQCFGYTFNPAIWKQDLGVSVLLHFANATDGITLYKAWVRVAP